MSGQYLFKYTFRDGALREQALTHRSANAKHNERLEFLGDALLNQVIAIELYQRFPLADEGEMSRMRAALVKEKTLADIAFELQLGDLLHLGSGELKSGGFRRESILADALEALFGAVFIDGGMAACHQQIVDLFQTRLLALDQSSAQKDPKTLLQEWLQSRRLNLPTYELLATDGDAHAQVFRVGCRLETGEVTEGVGSSRRRAEQQAAELLLQEIVAAAAEAQKARKQNAAKKSVKTTQVKM